MAIFKDTTITDNGRALIADTLANNKQIIFTRMITSSKIYEDSSDVSKLTNIDEIKQTVSMSKISQEGTRVRLNAVFTNSTVNTSYKIQTIGLYAKTGTGNEILYSITRAKEPDVMPATNGINLATVEIDLITEINNSNGATMLMNPSTLVTTSNLVAELEKIAGLKFGGNIQDIGNKTRGKFYYDNVTKFYYECIEDNSLTYNDSEKFRAISNKPISDKVENLFKKELLNPSEKGIYVESTGFTEWIIPIPHRINKNNVIALTNVEIVGNCEYSHIDYNLNCFRLGVKGNASNSSPNDVKLLVVYLT